MKINIYVKILVIAIQFGPIFAINISCLLELPDRYSVSDVVRDVRGRDVRHNVTNYGRDHQLRLTHITSSKQIDTM